MSLAKFMKSKTQQQKVDFIPYICLYHTSVNSAG